MTWVAVVIGVAVLMAWMWFIGQQLRGSTRRAEELTEHKLQALRQEWSHTLHQTQQLLGQQLDGNAQVITDVHRKLGELDIRSQQMLDVGTNIATLQDLLKAPKVRGTVGEMWLGQLLAEHIPRHYFEEQYSFKSGERIDAVIKLGERLVPVDSKFPLECFQRQLSATSDEERARCRREFERAVRTHIGSIAKKYILPDEGTYEFALMYIPSEQVYYETIAHQEGSTAGASLLEHALKQRVIPVSPNTFFAYLQVILLGLRGLSIEREASVIMRHLAQLRGDVTRFIKEFQILGKHVKDAKDTFERSDRALDRLEGRLVAIDQPQPEAALTPMEVSAHD